MNKLRSEVFALVAKIGVLQLYLFLNLPVYGAL